jgi:hypothetical protein
VSEENTGGYSQKYISSAKEHVGFEERKRENSEFYYCPRRRSLITLNTIYYIYT